MEPETKILEGAKELFYRFGVRSVTMDDIAKHLGMSKKTIYQCYKDKDEIIHTMMKQEIKNDEEVFLEAFEKSANVVEEVFNMMKTMTEIFSKINPLMFYELQKYYPKTWALIRDFKEGFVLKIVEQSLNKGKDDGYVRQDVHNRILARLRLEQIDLAFNPGIYPPDKFSPLQVHLAFAEHFLYGVCTLKGHKLINKYKQIQEEE